MKQNTIKQLRNFDLLLIIIFVSITLATCMGCSQKKNNKLTANVDSSQGISHKSIDNEIYWNCISCQNKNQNHFPNCQNCGMAKGHHPVTAPATNHTHINPTGQEGMNLGAQQQPLTIPHNTTSQSIPNSSDQSPINRANEVPIAETPNRESINMVDSLLYRANDEVESSALRQNITVAENENESESEREMSPANREAKNSQNIQQDSFIVVQECAICMDEQAINKYGTYLCQQCKQKICNNCHEEMKKINKNFCPLCKYENK
jgi:hypothetical protein